MTQDFRTLYVEFPSKNLKSCLKTRLEIKGSYFHLQEKDKKHKTNYRPISILSNIPKICERCILKQFAGRSNLTLREKCPYS